jgi:lipid II:glycine glycyltransferase (peptidoglycan interpeptide bridge formation enzyme)
VLFRSPNTRDTQLQAVVDEVSAAIRKLSPSYAYVQLPPAFRDIRPFMWNGYQEVSHFTYIVDIDRPLEEVWAGFGTKLRWNLKNVAKLPLRVERVSDTETFYDIVVRRYAEQGMTFPMTGAGYLKDLMEAFPDNVKMYFLYNGEEIASAITVTQYKGRMIHWMGNARLDTGIAGNDHMVWTLMQKAKEEGCKEFELQGAGDRRLSHYKSKYNPRLEVCYAVTRKDPLGNAAEWAYYNFKRRSPVKMLANKLAQARPRAVQT